MKKYIGMKRINLSEQQDPGNSGENKTNILDFGVGGSEPPCLHLSLNFVK